MHIVSVFISHSWAYSDHYRKLEEWIFRKRWFVGETPLGFRNASIPKDNPIHYARNDAQLQEKIYEKIALCSVLICPTGMYATHSKWISKELNGAKLLGKPILAVDPWAQERKSSLVSEVADETVGWTSKSVASGIWRLCGR